MSKKDDQLNQSILIPLIEKSNTAKPAKKPRQKKKDPAPPSKPPLLAAATERAAKTKIEATVKTVVSGQTSLRRSTGGIGRTTAGLTGLLSHYLPANRFSWWDASISTPETGPIVPSLAGNDDPALELMTEFYSEIATVVGSRLDDIRPAPIARKIPWNGVTDANLLAGTEFVVRRWPGEVLPTLSEVELPMGVSRLRIAALTHPVAPNRPPITSLIVDFFVPQRAVGLEAGFLSADQRGLGGNFFELIARRVDGSEIARSTGESIRGNILWNANGIYHIGVRDRAGEIASVELCYTEEGAFTAADRLFITRLWYEGLPAAAVYQGTLYAGDEASFREFQQELHPDIDLVPGHAHSSPFDRLRLPYRCRSAVVFMRGFKLGRRAEEAVKVQRLGAGIYLTPLGNQEVRLNLSADFEKEIGKDGGEIVAAVYFTLLAWDPERVELFRSGSPGYQRHGQSFAFATDCFNEHPGARETGGSGQSAEQRLGPLIAGINQFQFLFDEPRELQLLMWSPGEVNGTWLGPLDETESTNLENAIDGALIIGTIWLTLGLGLILLGPSLGPGNLEPVVSRSPPLGYSEVGRKIRWGWGASFGSTIDEDESASSGASAVILGGRGLVPHAPARTAVTVALTPQRRLQNAPFYGEIAFELEAEMAFVYLGSTIVVPEDEIRELDVEVRGEAYDGHVVDIQVGGGVDLRPSTDDVRLIAGVPRVAGVVRKTQAAVHDLRVQDLEFIFQEGFIITAPEQTGAMRNNGNVPAVITAATLYESVPGLLRSLALVVEFRGQSYAVEEIATRGPLVLAPSETLAVTGRFYTTDAAAWANPGVLLQFQTNVPGRDRVNLIVTARLIASDALATLVPSTINFGITPLPFGGGRWQVPRTRIALLTSDGTTPLLVSAVEFVPAVPGLSVLLAPDNSPPGASPPAPEAIAAGALYQLDPGTSLRFALLYWPEAPSRFETVLRITTNAGIRRSLVRGEAVA